MDNSTTTPEDQELTNKLTALTPAERMLFHFHFAHLPDNLRAASRHFAELAARMVADTPRNPERTAGLRKLLEAKDCFVRAVREGAL